MADERDDSVRAELCPDGYNFMDHPQHGRRGRGGTGLLFCDSLCVKKVDAGARESFEFSDYSGLLYQLLSTFALCISATAYPSEHRVPTNVFYRSFMIIWSHCFYVKNNY